MTNLENQLHEAGFSPADVDIVTDLIEQMNAEHVREQAAHLICLVFLRVEKDSPAGCALRRALGFSGGVSLQRAAKDFCVSKQYLETLQSKLEAELGTLSFLARQAREANAPGPHEAGPPGGSASHR